MGAPRRFNLSLVWDAMGDFLKMDNLEAATTFPPELDVEWFGNKNGLGHLSTQAIEQYFYSSGRDAGLPGSELCDFHVFGEYVARKYANGSILQISPPSYIIPGKNVKFAHWNSRPTPLMAKMGKSVDYVIPGHDFSGIKEKFDCVFSFHQLQYVVDIIAFINGVAACLRPGGVFCCVVGDARFTFEQGRRPSEMEEAIAVHYGGPCGEKPALLTWLLTHSHMRHNSAERHWANEHGGDPDVDFHELISVWHAKNGFFEGRNWVFTSQTFRRFFDRLFRLGFINLKLLRCYNTQKNSNAFNAVFVKGGGGSLPVNLNLPEPCNGVMVGKDGMLFLAQGTNRLLDQYFALPEKVVEEARTICSVFWERKKFFSENGMDFLQLAIPEKNSVHCGKLAADFPESTPLYALVNSNMNDCPWYMDARTAVANNGGYQKQDTHLTTSAALAVVKEMLDRLNLAVDMRLEDLARIFRPGDLLYMLTGSNDYKVETELAASLSVAGKIMRPGLIDSYDPPKGHVGKIRKFQNPDAPINKRLLCFGNSFFGTGEFSSNLTWYFARLFRNFDFYWQPRINRETIFMDRPDIVICQTIERYMCAIPRLCAEEFRVCRH